MKPIKHPLLLAVIFVLAGCAHGQRSDCAAPVDTHREIELTIRALFDALQQDDAAAFQRVTTTSFYSFDAGKRFAGTELLDLVRDARGRGVQLNWSIGPIDTKLRCDVAWSAWENVGSAGVPPDLRPVRWLESAVLVRQNGSWKIDFFHSQRAAQD